ncbi:MAG: FAD:protein FMN transferase [Candidatus Omnitrophica bacterium]|nr:FAD:protein FMN transferase [Candidatus Omnitrophota bacterium]
MQSVKRKTETKNSCLPDRQVKLLTLSFNFSLFALSFTLLCGCQNRSLYKNTQVMMGTFVEVTSGDKEAAGIVFSEIKRIEALLSKYNSDSEITELNRTGKLAASPDTFYIINKSKEFWLLSDGAFDITVGPLIDLWGFTHKEYYLPTEEEINNALKLVGMNKIILNQLNNVVEFTLPGMEVDLGAIAKGYSLDCAVKKLQESGIKSCLINAGGQVYCLGDKPRSPLDLISYFKEGRGKFGSPWKVAVKNPRGEKTIDYLELKDCSVATSGDYEQYFIKENKRYSHILNPKSGYPADSGIASVTVIAPTGLIADALSTSIFVLGKEKGMELAKKFKDVTVKIIESK